MPDKPFSINNMSDDIGGIEDEPVSFSFSRNHIEENHVLRILIFAFIKFIL